jgi:mRNA-binding protein PUF3
LEHVLHQQQAELVKELEPNVMRCVKDQNGNHVIQKAIECINGQYIQFVFDAFDGKFAELANHAYGCRVIQRVLERCKENPVTRRRILTELHACGSTLISDQYGNYVTQHMIEHGDPEDRAIVINLVKLNLLAFSKHKFASNVVEKCLAYGTPQQRREMMEELVSKPDSLCQLVKDSYGNYVIRE